MRNPVLSVPLRDLEAGVLRREWPLPVEWLNAALKESEADSDGSEGRLSVDLKKNGRQVLINGQVTAGVVMPCARTLEPVNLQLEAPIVLLLSPRTSSASPAARSSRAEGHQPSREPTPTSPSTGAPAGRPRRNRRGRDKQDDELLSADLAARDEYDGETVVLDDFVREHLLLELPLFPVRSDLPFVAAPTTDTRPDRDNLAENRPLDPRLAPLAELARELNPEKE